MELVVVLGGVAMLAVQITWRAYVLTILWGWFVVQQFGVPQIGVAQAVGLWAFATLLTYYPRPKDTRSAAQRIGESLAGPLVVLAVAWIAKGFV